MHTKAQLEAELAAHRHGRVPRELRRRQVLLLARELFVERGYEGTSMDELARRAGVSKPVIYSIAGSKEALLRDVMAAIDEELATCVAMAVAAEPDDDRRLHAGILAFLRFVEARRDEWGALLASDSGPPRSAYRESQARQARVVAGLLAAGVDDADTRTAELVAQIINGAVEFAALWWRDHPDVPAEAVAELLLAAFSPDVMKLAARRLGPSKQDGKARKR